MERVSNDISIASYKVDIHSMNGLEPFFIDLTSLFSNTTIICLE